MAGPAGHQGGSQLPTGPDSHQVAVHAARCLPFVVHETQLVRAVDRAHQVV